MENAAIRKNYVVMKTIVCSPGYVVLIIRHIVDLTRCEFEDLHIFGWLWLCLAKGIPPCQICGHSIIKISFWWWITRKMIWLLNLRKRFRTDIRRGLLHIAAMYMKMKRWLRMLIYLWYRVNTLLYGYWYVHIYVRGADCPRDDRTVLILTTNDQRLAMLIHHHINPIF